MKFLNKTILKISRFLLTGSLVLPLISIGSRVNGKNSDSKNQNKTSDPKVEILKPQPEIEIYLEEGQRVFLKFLLYGHSLPTVEAKLQNLEKVMEILKVHYRGKKNPNTLLRAPRQIEVTSIESFIENVYSRNLDQFSSLEEEIRHYSENGIESPQIHIKDPGVALEIKQYLIDQGQLGKKLWTELATSLNENQSKASTSEAASNDRNETNTASIFDLEKIFETLKNGTPAEKKSLAITLSDKTVDLLFAKIENAGADFARTANLEKIETRETKGAGRFVELLLTKYFARLSVSTKTAIISSAIDHPGYLAPQKIMNLVTINSGVIMTKWLQILARAPDLPAEFANTLKALESKGKRLPPTVLEKVILRELPELEKNGIQLNLDNSGRPILSSKMIPVGSVAQTQFIYALINGKKIEVALRITKPGTLERFREEKEMFYPLIAEIDGDPELIRVGFPKVSPTLDDIVNAMEVEFDSRVAANHQKTGRSVYIQEVKLSDGTIFKLSVPEVYYSSPNLMISSRVYGENLEKVMQVNQGLAKDIMDRIARLWLTRALLDKLSFFNSDMHWGNFLVEIKSGVIEVSVLDFGMSDSIPLPLRKNFVGLAAGSIIKNPILISDMLWDLQKDDPNTALTKDTLVQKVSEKMDSKSKVSPLEWVKLGVTWGLDYRSEFVGFNRGLTAIMMGMGKTRDGIPGSRSLAELLISENTTSNFLKGLRLVPFGKIAGSIIKSWTPPGKNQKAPLCSQLFK